MVRVVNEPTAAAIAYGRSYKTVVHGLIMLMIILGLDKTGDERHVIVYDLGGGTFDVSLLVIDNGVFDVLATSGDTHLGGEDLYANPSKIDSLSRSLTVSSDQRVITYLAKQYNKKNNVDITKDPKTMGKLKREVEKAKRTLSSQMSTRIEIESFHKGNDFSETMTRAKFEELNMDLVCNLRFPSIPLHMLTSRIVQKDPQASRTGPQRLGHQKGRSTGHRPSRRLNTHP